MAGHLIGIEGKSSATVTSYANAEAVPFGPDLFALPLANLWQPQAPVRGRK